MSMVRENTVTLICAYSQTVATSSIRLKWSHIVSGFQHLKVKGIIRAAKVQHPKRYLFYVLMSHCQYRKLN